jgi:hypothetical protein
LVFGHYIKFLVANLFSYAVALWALWQKYENGDETYSDIIAGKIVKEYVMYQ